MSKANWDDDRALAIQIGDQIASACEAFMELELLIGSDGVTKSDFTDQFNEILAVAIGAKVAKQTLLDVWPGAESSHARDHLSFYVAAPGCLDRLQWAFDLFHLAMRMSVAESISAESKRGELIEAARETAFRVLSENLEMLGQLADFDIPHRAPLDSAILALEQDCEQNLTPLFAEMKAGFK